MGCASSTPMVATAGSEFLKTASHVAADATKSAENAVQGTSSIVLHFTLIKKATKKKTMKKTVTLSPRIGLPLPIP